MRAHSSIKDWRNGDQPTVPYITTWATERSLPAQVTAHPSGVGIAYADEGLGDRDGKDVLWMRTHSRPGHGRPVFGEVHTARQRRAMRVLLCQVCAGPADRTDDGVLWVLKDDREAWPGWPERMGVTEPPICLPCLRFSVNACPALRKGYVVVRVRDSTVSGIYGLRYRPGRPFPTPSEPVLLPFDAPTIRWTLASQLVSYS